MGVENSRACGRLAMSVTDPRIAPADGHMETWEHFGITAEALVGAVSEL